MGQPAIKIYAETERLILRELLPTDDKDMFELDSDPEVHRYLGNKPIKTIAESQSIIAYVRKQYMEAGIGRWAVIEKNTGKFIGWCGIKLITDTINKHSGFYDIGYRFIKQHWGKGYATESAKAVLHYGFNTLNLPEIYGMADVDNKASNHILQNIGLNFIEKFDHNGILCNWYILKRAII